MKLSLFYTSNNAETKLIKERIKSKEYTYEYKAPYNLKIWDDQIIYHNYYQDDCRESILGIVKRSYNFLRWANFTRAFVDFNIDFTDDSMGIKNGFTSINSFKSLADISLVYYLHRHKIRGENQIDQIIRSENEPCKGIFLAYYNYLRHEYPQTLFELDCNGPINYVERRIKYMLNHETFRNFIIRNREFIEPHIQRYTKNMYMFTSQWDFVMKADQILSKLR